uniref:N-succinylarginine dihydrolase n=1 Tax=Yersinia enterocolitica TaxID=630 RepID=UPI00223935FD|nr:N-succinylarginine dihydrolase [Yersinia enterocolitica]
MKYTLQPTAGSKTGPAKNESTGRFRLQARRSSPQERPAMGFLRQLGFSGSDEQVLSEVVRKSPRLLSAVSSASSMWTANAATVSPAADSADGRVHFTVANLNNKFHRAIEADTTSAILKSIFNNHRHFVHHDALPSVELFGDEGAANHNRLGGEYDRPAIQVFVYGRQGFENGAMPSRYPARQH